MKDRQGLDDAALQQLRDAHRARCHHFRLLLEANNRALEAMSDLEEALKGTQPFGLTYLRTQAVRVATNVYQIITHLNTLCGGKYPLLFERHKAFQAAIHEILKPAEIRARGALVIPLEDVGIRDAGEVGSKMASLAEASRALAIPIPEGFVVTASGFARLMEANTLQVELDRLMQSANPEMLSDFMTLSAALQQHVMRAEIPSDLTAAILGGHARLCGLLGPDVRVAMRSSALGEDLRETTFAGQYRSELNVCPDILLETYKDIVASKYGVTAMMYRLNRGIPDESVAMCVGCMRMVDAVAGGVAYSRNPMNALDDSVVVYAVWGLPQAVVDGSTASDRFEVARTDPPSITRRVIAAKTSRCVLDEEDGVRPEPLDPAMGVSPSLDDATVARLTAMVLRIEAFFGQPQDVEWALDQAGELYLLQCRPLQVEPARSRTPDAVAEEDAGDEGVLLRGGVTASSGAAFGAVRRLCREVDALECPQGAVVVVAQALPRWATVLSRAVAVIAEQGSDAGHLANVAREFQIPALFGLSDAMAVLEEGETVTVDADARRVWRGVVEERLAGRPKPRNLMLGSPVYQTLELLAPWLIPLTLLDPDAPEFDPAHCATMHDITRFCHEMAVREMFQTMRDLPVPEASCKQLWHGAPMQYWIVDLDDGLVGPVQGNLVRLEQITSGPMLALWRGMTAVPLEGPPQLDARGFMAVLMESVVNPDLEPSQASSFQTKNYFMISRTFCSLQSRFGYHFCTVEAQVTDEAEANYASFRFKGGAADLGRRAKRALFIADFLEGLRFRVEIKQDALFARQEGLASQDMLRGIEAVGYLVMHTRQLDMIMDNDGLVQAARDKMQSDLANLRESYGAAAPRIGG
ncbi:MAG: PEP/pyruvate-binding domain-containing protein [Desulfovibrionaceae bacterium]